MREVLDSRFFSTHFFSDDKHALEATRAKLSKLRRERRGLIPSIVIAEVVNMVCQRAGRDIARSHLRGIEAFGLRVVSLDATIAAEAGLLRCTYRNLPSADAIVAATAIKEDGTVVSDDPHFRQVRGLRMAWLD